MDLDTLAAIQAEAIRQGETVTYASGGQTVDLSALVGRQKFASDDDRGNVRFEYSDADFLVVAADLELGGSPHTPERGDTITWGTRTFRVRPFGPERHYRTHGPTNACFRIHTEEVKTPTT